MIHKSFYMRTRFEKWSPMITQWADDNSVFLFDFDECMYDPLVEEHIEQSLTEASLTYKILAIVELHPFVIEDELYHERVGLIKQVARRCNLQIIYLTADYRLWDNNAKTLDKTFFPGWYFILRDDHIHAHSSYAWPQERQYTFSCNIMGNFRTEKIFNILEVRQRKRADWLMNLWYFESRELGNGVTSDVFGIENVQGVTPEQIKFWKEEVNPTFHLYQNDFSDGEVHLSAMNLRFPGCTDAYCNLVMEHSMEIEILSEKSYKPFAAEQIPVYAASAGAARALSTLGFDLFYDFINHDHYDFVELYEYPRDPAKWHRRMKKVHSMIDDLYATDYMSFIKHPSTRARLIKNREYFYSDAIEKMCLTHLKKLL